MYGENFLTGGFSTLYSRTTLCRKVAPKGLLLMEVTSSVASLGCNGPCSVGG